MPSAAGAVTRSLPAGRTGITAVTAAAGASKHRLPSVAERQYKQHSHYDSDQIRYSIHQISFLTAPVFIFPFPYVPEFLSLFLSEPGGE